MARFDDGVYLEWSKFGGRECDQPRSIVVIENEFMVIHVNPLDPTVIRFPYRNSIGTVREHIKHIDSYEEYVDHSHELLMKLWGPTVTSHERIQHFQNDSVMAKTWKSVGESWWNDFDDFLDLAHPKLMAWIRSIGPCQWLVTVGRRTPRNVSNITRPIIQFTIWGKTSRDVGKVVHAFRKPIADNLESLMGLGLENQSD